MVMVDVDTGRVLYLYGSAWKRDPTSQQNKHHYTLLQSSSPQMEALTWVSSALVIIEIARMDETSRALCRLCLCAVFFIWSEEENVLYLVMSVWGEPGHCVTALL